MTIKIDVNDLLTQAQRFGIGYAVVKVITDSIPQINGFANIDHCAGCIFHEIAAGFMR